VFADLGEVGFAFSDAGGCEYFVGFPLVLVGGDFLVEEIDLLLEGFLEKIFR
jgi:hypothetical protein